PAGDAADPAVVGADDARAADAVEERVGRRRRRHRRAGRVRRWDGGAHGIDRRATGGAGASGHVPDRSLIRVPASPDPPRTSPRGPLDGARGRVTMTP